MSAARAPRLLSPGMGAGCGESRPRALKASPCVVPGTCGLGVPGPGASEAGQTRGPQSRPARSCAAAECVPNYRSRGEARGLDSVMEMKQNCFLPESLQNSLL